MLTDVSAALNFCGTQQGPWPSCCGYSVWRSLSGSCPKWQPDRTCRDMCWSVVPSREQPAGSGEADRPMCSVASVRHRPSL